MYQFKHNNIVLPETDIELETGKKLGIKDNFLQRFEILVMTDFFFSLGGRDKKIHSLYKKALLTGSVQYLHFFQGFFIAGCFSGLADVCTVPEVQNNMI